jgi:hypothetical protein
LETKLGNANFRQENAHWKLEEGMG